MRSILLILFCLLFAVTAKSQKWQNGYFTDTRGTRNPGQINISGSGRAPIKGEAFIEYREDPKSPSIKLSASDIKSFVMGVDSFVVAANGGWSRYELDFVRVALVSDEMRLYQAYGSDGGGGSGIGIEPGIGVGVGGGTGGFGGGVGGGISLPIGGGSSRGGGKGSIYFYGSSTANMKPISNQEFVDVMTEIMGDQPDIVDQIKANKYNLGNIEKLIAAYKKAEAAHLQ
jgi:hypothetical protein